MSNSIVTIKNISGASGTWKGQSFDIAEKITLSATEVLDWASDEDIFEAVATHKLCVGDGTDEFPDHIEGWNWLIGNNDQILPLSDIDSNKLMVHSSTKPRIDGEPDFYVIWTSTGDDTSTGTAAEGEPLSFHMTTGVSSLTKDVKFDQSINGRVFIAEAYLKFDNGGEGDSLTSEVVASPTVLQQAVNLDLVVTNNIVSYSQSGPGTGTHGFAANPILIPRTFSLDGEWNFDIETMSLTPNFTGTGNFRIMDIEKPVHRFFNKLPCHGSSYGYFSMAGDETTELPAGFFVRVRVDNVSDGDWSAHVVMEIYRQVTM